MSNEAKTITMEIVTDPVVLAQAREQDARFALNWKWFEAHAMEIYRTHRGKCLAIAGQELFVGDTPDEAINLARSAHPHDNGLFTRIIPKERGARIYGNRRLLVSL
jgi:hypothetical protein